MNKLEQLKKEGFVKIGACGVDSGQLMVCDPSYIGSQWSNQTRPKARVFTHKDGTELYCRLHGAPPSDDAIEFRSFDDVIDKYNMTMNQMNAKGITTQIKKRDAVGGAFSYAGCCEVTLNDENQAGQLNFKQGLPGAGVVFSSGYGDGLYDVYAKIEDMGNWGPRITEVRIILIEEDDE